MRYIPANGIKEKTDQKRTKADRTQEREQIGKGN